jgi:hypothetical protein
MAEHLGVHHGDRLVAILATTGENWALSVIGT